MSGLFKFIGKVFKTILKVLPYVVAAAAVIFTGGAALGLTPSFGAVAATAGTHIAATLGLSTAAGTVGSTLATVLSGAITYAGGGAVAGAIMGAVSGKGIAAGLKQGAMFGAITGGALGALGAATGGSLGYTMPKAVPTPTAAGAANYSPVQPESVGDAGAVGADGTTSSVSPGLSSTTLADTAGAQVPGLTSPQLAGSAVQTPGILPPTGGLDQAALIKALQPTTLQTVAPLVGGAISGLGAGLGGAAQAQAQQQNQQAAYDQTAKNYSSYTPGLLTSTTNSGTAGLPSPVQRFATNFRYQYDPSLGQILQVPA